MRILFLGDVVGPPGVKLVQTALPLIRQHEQIDVVIANVENSSNGSGLTPKLFQRFRRAGAQLMTLGDHIYRRAEIIATLKQESIICKPANFPADAPGKEYAITNINDVKVAAVSLMGRTFMKPVDCPYAAADRVLAELQDQAQVIVVDVHAEATADKYLLGHHLNGKVSAVVGTHTHVPTADEQILSKGTAFICDVGMCGPYASILGRKVERVLPTSIDFIPRSFDVATEDVRLCGVIINVDPQTGKAIDIQRYVLRESELEGLQEQINANPVPANQ